MAKLVFNYGAMGSSKTANALMVAYNYEERGQHALILKPATDTRDGIHTVSSRIGLSNVDTWQIPVLCYGLRADFQNKFFPGSRRLMEIADEIKEIKTICWCGKKATCNARYDDNGIIKEGAQVVLGANDKYIALCRKHFKEGNLGK